MLHSTIYVGENPISAGTKEVSGQFVQMYGEPYYRIANYDQMRPFFMSIVSDSNHWIFISSNGGLTAGRRDAEMALFPYYTDDKIHDARDTGSKTLLLVERAGRKMLWEPFSNRYNGVYNIRRNLYKSLAGNRLLFEEINEDLGLKFQYAWGNSERFGFVKHAKLINGNEEAVSVSILDGIENLLPHGVEASMQSNFSTLLDAYKKNELETQTGLGIYRLSSLVVDKPEPTESLKASTVWSTGLHTTQYLLSSLQLDRFREGTTLVLESDVRAERGAYFINADIDLPAGGSQNWYLVAEVNQDASDVIGLIDLLAGNKSDGVDLGRLIEEDISRGTENLRRIVGSADGLQCTADKMIDARHFSNVLFNVMRGGVFYENGRIGTDDLKAFVSEHNQLVVSEQAAFFEALPAQSQISSLLKAAAQTGDARLERLCYEYLPMTFSRRHGDPSRPWNKFSIDVRKEDGSVALNYQGNWRDIFQNWEALACSYPDFVESMISKFVNASTPDGYNPYRITRSGIDWEEIDPSDPWSNIGYWGDHQVIYLLKLLELSLNHNPAALQTLLTRDIFAYANVPYQIKPYQALLNDPHNTIVYDQDLAEEIRRRVSSIGADGKLVWTAENQVYHINLAEKLLAMILAKMSNFIPEGGIWMNTQRPEWNDANNALVGFGISMVTLCYVRRFARFAIDLFSGLDEKTVVVSKEIAQLLSEMLQGMDRFEACLESSISPAKRKEIVDFFGEADSQYRTKIYRQGGFFGTRTEVPVHDVVRFFEQTLTYCDHTLRANQRDDRLFHAYNLMSNDEAGINVQYLYEMLEGQVAALSSGGLNPESTVEVLDALKASTIYREDQYSYMLYPDRRLPRFVDKNNIDPKLVEHSVLLAKLNAINHQELFVQDMHGGYHFNGDIRNKASLDTILNELGKNGFVDEVDKDRALILEVFEDEFDHRSYTGRSGTFFGYEGLGSIYWHMVSKLVLAIQESYVEACRCNANPAILGKLADFYYEARAGIGLNKSPQLYGAFPFDPYSHTPGNAGVQQPGLTGQVKEDILSRWGELGVIITEGCIHFRPLLLKKSEFLTAPTSFEYYDIAGTIHTMQLDKGMLAFTYCQTPILYRLSEEVGIHVTYSDGRKETLGALTLDRKTSQQIFKRSGEICLIEVSLMPAL